MTGIEVFLGTSPEWWKTATEEQQQEWTEANIRWLKDTFGEANVLLAVEHWDETTPHIQALVVPITADGRLAAKDWLGGAQKLSELQSGYHEAVEHLGLKRGERGSKATHTSVRAFYDALNGAQEGPEPSPEQGRALKAQVAVQSRELSALKRSMLKLSGILPILRSLSADDIQKVGHSALRLHFTRRREADEPAPSPQEPPPQKPSSF